CVELAQQFDEVYAAVGIHPHESAGFQSSAVDALRELTRMPKVVAVGEIGLDFYRHYAPRAAQFEAFTAQLALAAEVGLPVVVHNGAAADDVLACLAAPEASRRSDSDLPRGVLHCFAETEEVARLGHACGFLVSFAGMLTYPKSDELRQTARAISLDWTLVET